MRIDLHTHSSVSDGTDTPTQLVTKAFAAGLDVIALTDHDTFRGIPEAKEQAKRIGVTVLTGVEMATKAGEHTVHLLGYGCDPFDRALREELIKNRQSQGDKIRTMVSRLAEGGYAITSDDVIECAGDAISVGRPHVADALVAKGYVESRTAAFETLIGEGKPYYVTRYACPLERAIGLIRQARGLAVIAHPWGRESRAVLTEEYLGRLVREHGLEGIEVGHQEHSPADRELLYALGERLGLIRTGSSDYHGTGKVDHELGCNLTRESAYQEIVRRIKQRGGVV